MESTRARKRLNGPWAIFAQAAETAGTITTAVSAVTSTVSNAARNDQIAFSVPGKLNDPKMLLALIQKKALKKLLGTQIGPMSIPTAITSSNGTCTSTSCDATLNGSLNCPNGGTLAMENVAFTFTVPSGSLNTFSYAVSMDGKITMSACKSAGFNYLDFPNYVVSSSDGEMTIGGSSTYDVSNFTANGTTGFNFDYSITDGYTVNSSALSINGASAVAVSNLTNNMALTINSVVSNFTQTTSATQINVNVNKTFAGDKFTYDIDCLINLTDDAINVGSCDITVK